MSDSNTSTAPDYQLSVLSCKLQALAEALRHYDHLGPVDLDGLLAGVGGILRDVSRETQDLSVVVCELMEKAEGVAEQEVVNG